MSVQHNYHTLMKWEDKLFGQSQTTKVLNISRLNPTCPGSQLMVGIPFLLTIHVGGERNEVADSVSCYFKYDT